MLKRLRRTENAECSNRKPEALEAGSWKLEAGSWKFN
jgi:hypothetical protein